jgi:hypothetical protein
MTLAVDAAVIDTMRGMGPAPVNPPKVTSMVGHGPDHDDEFIVTHITSSHKGVDLPRTSDRDGDWKTVDANRMEEHWGNRSDQAATDDDRNADSKTGLRNGNHRSGQVVAHNDHREHNES